MVGVRGVCDVVGGWDGAERGGEEVFALVLQGEGFEDTLLMMRAGWGDCWERVF